MDIFFILNNINDVIYDLFKSWLNKQFDKWLLKINGSEIICICNTTKYARLNNSTHSFVNYINKINNNNYDLKDVFKLKKIIKNETIFSEYLQKNFNVELINIELKGYDKNYINSLFLKEKEKITCLYCNKEFKLTFVCNRHQKFNCKQNKDIIVISKSKKNKITNNNDLQNNNIPNNDLLNKIRNELKMEILNELKNENKNKDSIIENKLDELKDEIKEFTKNLSNNNINNININTINNNTINNNTININLKTKIDKLNFFCKDTIDIDTFIKNFETNTKYHLTKDEALILLDNIEGYGINAYGDGLLYYLKNKYCLQLADLTGDEQEIKDCVLPFISNDVNLRAHYEKSLDGGWVLVKSIDKIRKILNISDNQIFNHHHKPIFYSKKGKKPICNILLRKSDYMTIEKNNMDKSMI